MAKWFLTSLVIILAVLVTPSLGFLQIVDDIMASLTNLLKTGIGGIKFTKDFAEFRNAELPDMTPKNRQEYDFIVVGAGSAGATITSRLTEIEGVNVLLIEAGDHENLIMDVPVFDLFLQLDKTINWAYKSEPTNDFCLGMTNRQCNFAKGRVMGGSSTLNFMIATRGSKHDYDEWYALTGDENWSYEGMMKSFKKLEKFDVKLADFDRNYHNFDGPVRIANPVHHTPLADAFTEAGVELGLPPLDYNGPKMTGFSYVQTNQDKGERVSTNRAYLHPAKGRKNLSLSMNSRVTKVLIHPETKTAYGVEFIKNGKKIEVLARKEVILSAGAMATPQLLMLSGIGPADHLRSLGIKVVQNLPVGENMMDHIAYGGLFFLVNETVGIVVPEVLEPRNSWLSDYVNKRKGLFTTLGGVECLGFINVDDPKADNDKPNIELLFGSATMVSDYLIHLPFGITETQFKEFFADKLYQQAWLIFPLLMKPKSRGKILLKNTDPLDKPRIIPNYFSHPDDVRVAVKGIRKAIEVSKTKAMQRYGSKLHDRIVPGCEKHKPDSDDYWECALRTYTITIWHHSGTCKMGRENDTSAVVNTKLQVKGVKGLRVADASIMPNIITGHINIPIIAIAEKIADIIKSDYGYTKNRVVQQTTSTATVPHLPPATVPHLPPATVPHLPSATVPHLPSLKKVIGR